MIRAGLVLALVAMTGLYLRAEMDLRAYRSLYRQVETLQSETFDNLTRRQGPILGWQDHDRRRATRAGLEPESRIC